MKETGLTKITNDGIQMDDLLKKLNFYYLNKSREEAKRIAEKLIDILNKIGTDSPVYPVYRIKQTWLRNHGRTKKECDNEI